MGEEDSGDRCEVCKDSKFVNIFCNVLGGDEECVELTKRAGRGEMTQEEYFARVIEKYGREKVSIAMEKALIRDKIELPTEGTKPQVVQPSKPEVPAPKVQEPKVEIPEEERKLAEGIASEAEKKEMEKRAKAMPKYKTSLKGMCLPCIGDTIGAVMSVIKMWYTDKDKDNIDSYIKRMQAGELNVEDALKEVLKMSGGKDCLNAVLTDMNKIIDFATDLALKEKPELAEEKK